MVRFLHTADLHLDRPFEGLTSLGSQEGKLLQANLNVLKKIISLALSEQVDFLLIAGDTFHQNRPSLRMQRLFIEQMQRLVAADIMVFLIFGNHDYYEANKYWFTFPDNVTLFTKEQVETKQFTTKNNETVAVSAFSFTHAHIQANKAVEYPNRANVNYHIGMYHGGQAQYAPFQVSELVSKGYDYWALGHIHVPQILQQTPLIVYPGAPQGHTQKETQITGVTLVESQGSQLVTRQVPVAEVLWQPLTLSLKTVANLPDVVPYLKTKLAFEQLTIVQLTLVDFAHLADEFIFQVESQELLHVLHEVVADNVLLQEIVLEKNEDTSRVTLDVAEEAFQQVLALYSDNKMLQTTLQELYQQPEMHRLLVQNPEFMSDVLGEAQRLLKQDFQMRGEQDENH